MDRSLREVRREGSRATRWQWEGWEGEGEGLPRCGGIYGDAIKRERGSRLAYWGVCADQGEEDDRLNCAAAPSAEQAEIFLRVVRVKVDGIEGDGVRMRWTERGEDAYRTLYECAKQMQAK